eukprot:76146-Chlamydomonas_euryale.AAC.1
MAYTRTRTRTRTPTPAHEDRSGTRRRLAQSLAVLPPPAWRSEAWKGHIQRPSGGHAEQGEQCGRDGAGGGVREREKRSQ